MTEVRLGHKGIRSMHNAMRTPLAVAKGTRLALKGPVRQPVVASACNPCAWLCDLQSKEDLIDTIQAHRLDIRLGPPHGPSAGAVLCTIARHPALVNECV